MTFFPQKWKRQQMSSRFKDLCTSRYLGAQPGSREEQTRPTVGAARGEYLTLGLSHRWPLAFQLVGWWEPENATSTLLAQGLCVKLHNSLLTMRTFLHFCQGPWRGHWLPQPGAPSTCHPEPCGWSVPPKDFDPAQHIMGAQLLEESEEGMQET